MLKMLTAGESHGKCLTAIIEGCPSGIEVSPNHINHDLRRRQGGYGRGGRMKIERDRAEITSGVRHGVTLGSPIALLIENKDWVNWLEVMSPEEAGEGDVVTRPRPGHADLSGALKYNHRDVRNVLERSSARETAARVAVGAVAKRILERFGIKVYSWVSQIGGAYWDGQGQYSGFDEIFEKAEASDVRCPDKKTSDKMRKAVDAAKKNGDSIGGVFEVVITGVPPGLGSHVHWDRKLDARLAQAVMSIQAIKGVEVGLGFTSAELPGSKVHDEIFYSAAKSGSAGFWPVSPRFYRKTNNAGGIEGGMSNGEPIVLRAVMKPIPTLYKPLRSIDINTKKPFEASIERSDTCAVPAAGVVAEAVAAFTLAEAFLEKTGGDSAVEIERNYRGYLKQVAGF